MIWKLLLTLAVLGICYSNGQDGPCSTDGDCKSVCGTCDTSNGVCTPQICKEGLKCNATTGECEKKCNVARDCPNSCYSCIKKDSDSSYCVPYTCDYDLQCWIENPTDKVGKCVCTVGSCEKRCDKGNACCSMDYTCNCCTQGQTCYKSTAGRANPSWGHRMLQMAKAVINRSCQNLCEKDDSSECNADNCERCRFDPNDSTDSPRKVCLPCSATTTCNRAQGENVCCTECGCVCCENGQTCKDKSCQCDETSCKALCDGKCGTAGQCTPGPCDGDKTCSKNEKDGGYSCQ